MTSPSAAAVIELSTVYFSERAVPPTITLADCGLQMRSAQSGVLTALYGSQGKQEGFMAARAYAEKHRLQFTVVDFVVALEHRINPGLMKPEEIAQHDFMATQRMAKQALADMKTVLLDVAADSGINADALEAEKPGQLLLEYPRLLTALLSHPDFAHLRVFAYQAKPLMSERPLSVAAVPHAHWAAIQEANCRLNPTTRVVIGNAPAPAPVQTRTEAPRARAVPSKPR